MCEARDHQSMKLTESRSNYQKKTLDQSSIYNNINRSSPVATFSRLSRVCRTRGKLSGLSRSVGQNIYRDKNMATIITTCWACSVSTWNFNAETPLLTLNNYNILKLFIFGIRPRRLLAVVLGTLSKMMWYCQHVALLSLVLGRSVDQRTEPVIVNYTHLHDKIHLNRIWCL